MRRASLLPHRAATDLARARREGRASSGNGRRESYQHLPMVRMTNTMLLPGDDDPDAIKLMRRLSIVSRRRWPKEGYGDRAVTVGVPPPKKKKAAAPKADADGKGDGAPGESSAPKMAAATSPTDAAVTEVSFRPPML